MCVLLRFIIIIEHSVGEFISTGTSWNTGNNCDLSTQVLETRCSITVSREAVVR